MAGGDSQILPACRGRERQADSRRILSRPEERLCAAQIKRVKLLIVGRVSCASCEKSCSCALNRPFFLTLEATAALFRPENRAIDHLISGRNGFEHTSFLIH